MNDFQSALAHKLRLEQAYSDASKAMQDFPKGEMGLTPDTVRASVEFRAAKSRLDSAFSALKAFNSQFLKRFKREYRAFLHSKRPTL